MSVKNPKPPAALRKIRRLERQLEQASDRREMLNGQFLEYKRHAQGLLTEYLAKIRRQDETLASNNMTIQELNDQVAVQWRQRAEARSDVERAEKLASEAVAKHNRMVQEVQEWRALVNDLRRNNNVLRDDLSEARRTLRYRIWVVVTRSTSQLQAWLSSKALRLKNRWFIRRLSKARVTAMQEAGYIPEKLIKVAHRYWEADRERINGDVYTEVTTPHGPKTIIEKPSWLQKWKIWRGRA